MKNQFSLSRFSLLFKKHTIEHYKTYLMSLVVLVGVLGLVMGSSAYTEKEYPLNATKQYPFFFFFLFLAGSIFTSTIFSNLSDKKQATITLLLPASQFEKYLVGWVFSYVIFQVFYIAAFYLVDVLVVNMDEWGSRPKEILNVFSPKPDHIVIFLGYALIHSFTMLGAIYFQKLHFVKTAFIFFVLCFLLIMLNQEVLELLIGRKLDMAIPFSQFSFHEGDTFHFVNAPLHMQKLVAILPLVLALIFWVTSYVRLTEKQI